MLPMVPTRCLGAFAVSMKLCIFTLCTFLSSMLFAPGQALVKQTIISPPLLLIHIGFVSLSLVCLLSLLQEFAVCQAVGLASKPNLAAPSPKAPLLNLVPERICSVPAAYETNQNLGSPPPHHHRARAPFARLPLLPLERMKLQSFRRAAANN